MIIKAQSLTKRAHFSQLRHNGTRIGESGFAVRLLLNTCTKCDSNTCTESDFNTNTECDSNDTYSSHPIDLHQMGFFFAMSISKKECNAVERNTLKRRVRAIVQQLERKQRLQSMYVLFKLNKKCLKMSSNELERMITDVLL